MSLKLVTFTRQTQKIDSLTYLAVSKRTEYKLKNDTKSCDESNFFFNSA